MAILSSAAAAATAGAPASSAAPAPAAAATRRPSPGVGAWYSSQVDSLLRDSGTSWYHTWAPHHDWITTPEGCEFVPTIWGRNDVTATGLQQAKANGQTLLGFHKPDESGQSNITPSAALSLWPQLEGTGLRLGAPAVSNAHLAGGWLASFMSGAASQGRRVDFIPLHWYPSPSILSGSGAVSAAVNQLSQYLQAVHSRFGLPLWLTEFSMMGWSGSGAVVPDSAVQAEFLAAADSMMAGLPYVERWAWFSLTPFSSGVNASLYGANNAITRTGEQFRTIATVGVSGNEETTAKSDSGGGRTSPGVGAWYSNQVDSLLRDSGTSWYYTWASHHDWITTPVGCEFVPMIWGRNDVTSARLQQAKSNGQVLLGFNEPDRSDQANISPQTALSLWPQLEATGLRLGAPAVATHAHAPGAWLDSFMSGLASQGGRVDFVPVHWYPSAAVLNSSTTVDAAVNELSEYLQAVYSRYGLPLWLTEFSLISWSGTGADGIASQVAQAEFLAAADEMMAGMSFVERYAWFSLTPFAAATGASLYDSGNSLTPAGQQFRTITAVDSVEAERPAGGGPTSPGVGAWYTSQVDSLLRDSGTSWYLTWAPNHDWITTPAGCEFVPMIWGRDDVTSARLAEAKANGEVLLGFNAPDRPDQANLSPETALSLWPQLEGTGMRLGAPAVSRWAQVRGGWLDSFMSGAASQGRRVDFIPLHWYPTAGILSGGNVAEAAVDDLREYLQAVYDRFGLPLWLTEFSLISWGSGSPVIPSSSVQAEFLTAADEMMSEMSYVERYAWFSLTPLSGAAGASLYGANNAATAIGQQFRTIAAAS